jgi:hypothetical protein
MILLLLALLLPPAHAELCWSHPDRTIADDGDISWHWRMINGQKCWFRADRLLTKEDLVPAFDAKEFDGDGVVTGRKFYSPDELQGKSEEAAPASRWQDRWHGS